MFGFGKKKKNRWDVPPINVPKAKGKNKNLNKAVRKAAKRAKKGNNRKGGWTY